MFVSGEGASYHQHGTVPPQLRELLSFALRESTSTVVTSTGAVAGGNASDRAMMQYLPPAELQQPTVGNVIQERLFNSSIKFSAVEVGCNERPSSLPAGVFRRDGHVTIEIGRAHV